MPGDGHPSMPDRRPGGHAHAGRAPRRALTAALALASGVVGAVLAWAHAGRAVRPTARAPSPAWQLVVRFTWHDDAPDWAIESFKEEWRALQRYVLDNEPTTLLYVMSDADTGASRVTQVVERYTSKSSYLDIHRHTQAFLTFKSKTKNVTDAYASISGMSFDEDTESRAPARW